MRVGVARCRTVDGVCLVCLVFVLEDVLLRVDDDISLMFLLFLVVFVLWNALGKMSLYNIVLTVFRPGLGWLVCVCEPDHT